MKILGFGDFNLWACFNTPKERRAAWDAWQEVDKRRMAEVDELEQRLAVAEAERDKAMNISMNMMLRDQAIHAVVKEGYIPDHVLACFPVLRGEVDLFNKQVEVEHGIRTTDKGS